MTNKFTLVTARNMSAKVGKRPDFGPRLGWGTAMGILLLSISLFVWTNAQSIVVGLMNGGHITETSTATTLAAIQRSTIIGSAAGGFFSLRVVIGSVQVLLFSLSRITFLRLRDQLNTDPSASDWRPGRYVTDVDTGGSTELLTVIQVFLSGIPRKTAAILSKAAVFLWTGFTAAARRIDYALNWQPGQPVEDRFVLVRFGPYIVPIRLSQHRSTPSHQESWWLVIERCRYG